MVINKKVSKISKFVKVVFVGTDFVKVLSVGTVFVASVISSHVMIETSMILPSYLSFLHPHVAGFQIYIYFAHVMLFWVFTLKLAFIFIPRLI